MTEEEKMDKKLRATAKKTPDGTPAVKAKPPPAARRAENMSNVSPPSGTLQSYMARRKLELNRKRRQNPPSTITSSSTSGEKTSNKNLSKKYNRNGSDNDPHIKVEVNSFEMFDSDQMMDTRDSILTSFIKMEQDENVLMNTDRKRHSTENIDRLESFCSRESSGDENSLDNESCYTRATRNKVDSIATSPITPSFNAMNDTTDFSSLFRDNNHVNQQHNSNGNSTNSHLEPIGSVEEREELITSFSPLSRDISSSIAASPGSLSYPMSNSMVPSPTGSYPLSNNDLKVEAMTPSRYSPSPSTSSYPMSNELKTEPAFDSFAPSPASVPSFLILGEGDFSSFFSDQMSSSPNNNHSNSSNTHHLQLRENLSNEPPSTELEVYQKQHYNHKEHLNSYLQSDLLMLEGCNSNNMMPPLVHIQQQQQEHSSATSYNDLSLDVFPFDQVKMD